MPEDEVCGICRVQFDGTCPTCKYPGDDCALCTPLSRPFLTLTCYLCLKGFGKCGHSFHMVYQLCDLLYLTQRLRAAALLAHLDSARRFERIMSHVQTKYSHLAPVLGKIRTDAI